MQNQEPSSSVPVWASPSATRGELGPNHPSSNFNEQDDEDDEEDDDNDSKTVTSMFKRGLNRCILYSFLLSIAIKSTLS